MAYGVSILVAVMAIMLWPKAARRIFWACLVFLLALSAYDYQQAEIGRNRVRSALDKTFWRWNFIDPTTPLAEASYEGAMKMTGLYPSHWWEDESQQWLLREGVLNQWLAANDTWQKEMKTARELKVREEQRRSLARAREAWPSLLRVSSNPPGASVRIDRYECGKTPIDIEVTAGRTPILIYKEGYSDFQEIVEVPRGKSVSI
jgi:hypothetical protein